jgi:hypothetical protein
VGQCREGKRPIKRDRALRTPWGRYGGPGRDSCRFMRFWRLGRNPATAGKYWPYVTYGVGACAPNPTLRHPPSLTPPLTQLGVSLGEMATGEGAEALAQAAGPLRQFNSKTVNHVGLVTCSEFLSRTSRRGTWVRRCLAWSNWPPASLNYFAHVDERHAQPWGWGSTGGRHERFEPGDELRQIVDEVTRRHRAIGPLAILDP